MPTTEDLVQARVDIARMEVQIDTMSKALDALQASNAALTVKVDEVLRALSEARGGWRAMVFLGGAASTVGAGLTWLIQHFNKG